MALTILAQLKHGSASPIQNKMLRPCKEQFTVKVIDSPSGHSDLFPVFIAATSDKRHFFSYPVSEKMPEK